MSDTPRRNPCELEIDLFCQGLRIGPHCRLEQTARHRSRTRAGLGSGLELVIPGALKDIWMNAPVDEPFAARSSYVLLPDDAPVQPLGTPYRVIDQRNGERYRVIVPPEPDWYGRAAPSGTPMCRIGMLQGTYLGVYIGPPCGFWFHQPSMACRFCTTGVNVGAVEEWHKSVDDVVATAADAKRDSGVTFVHLNTGFESFKEHRRLLPYIRALKDEVGVLVGVQAIPALADDLPIYDDMIAAGVDHFSFCYEFHNPEWFARVCPGKAAFIGQLSFFRALEYTAERLPRGAVSGEIIAGIEPFADTIAAIDYITSVGAFPTVCTFRPLPGSQMADDDPPDYGTMRRVMAHLWEACRRAGIPMDVAPGIEVSLVVQPGDTVYLAPPGLRRDLWRLRRAAVRRLAAPRFRRAMQPRDGATASP